MKHYIAYHKVQEWGEYSVDSGQVEIGHYSKHPKSKLEKMIGQTVWVISGEKINNTMVYKLCSTYRVSHLEDETKNMGMYYVVGEGFGFIPQIDVTNSVWFAELFKEQNRFSFGLNQIKNEHVIQALEEKQTNYLEDATIPALDTANIPVEIDKLLEGTRKQITANVYERNPIARAACLAHYGYSCVICGFNFQNQYGDIGSEYIHVHHLTPVSQVGTEYEVDPVRDLRPVCPNCHAMLHTQKPPCEIETLQKIIRFRFDKLRS